MPEPYSTRISKVSQVQNKQDVDWTSSLFHVFRVKHRVHSLFDVEDEIEHSSREHKANEV